MKKILLLSLHFVTTICFAQNNQQLKLWYNKPSGTTWENALPIGNGKLGAMIYGNVDTETVQLNECTVWSGSPNRNDNDLCLDSLTEIRQLIFNGKQKEAEAIANNVIISKTSQGQMFEPVGELSLTFEGHDKYEDYSRELDIEKAIAKTSYKVGDVYYTREVLASIPDRVIVLRLTVSKPGSLSFVAGLAVGMPNAIIKANNAGQLTIAGTSMSVTHIDNLPAINNVAMFFYDNQNNLILPSAASCRM